MESEKNDVRLFQRKLRSVEGSVAGTWSLTYITGIVFAGIVAVYRTTGTRLYKIVTFKSVEFARSPDSGDRKRSGRRSK